MNQLNGIKSELGKKILRMMSVNISQHHSLKIKNLIIFDFFDLILKKY